MTYGARDYLKVIEQAKAAVSIPVIASVNCFTAKWWVTYARQIEAAGADALELNVYISPDDFEKGAADLENIHYEIIESVKSQIKIPVALKLSPYFTSFGHFAAELSKRGADALVLFNRYVQPEINPDSMSVSVKGAFNDPMGFSNALRWVALLFDKLELDLVASSGIKDSSDLVKQLLAGATAVQIASVLYIEGLGKIKKLLAGLEDWMTQKGFSSIDDFRGKLSQKQNPQSQAYVRAQYIKSITGIE